VQRRLCDSTPATAGLLQGAILFLRYRAGPSLPWEAADLLHSSQRGKLRLKLWPPVGSATCIPKSCTEGASRLGPGGTKGTQPYPPCELTVDQGVGGWGGAPGPVWDSRHPPCPCSRPVSHTVTLASFCPTSPAPCDMALHSETSSGHPRLLMPSSWGVGLGLWDPLGWICGAHCLIWHQKLVHMYWSHARMNHENC
jgi:hypothetical protein